MLVFNATTHWHCFQISQRFSQLICPQVQAQVSHADGDRVHLKAASSPGLVV